MSLTKRVPSNHTKPLTELTGLVNEVAFVPPLAIGKVPVTPVVKGKPVALVSVPLDGVPRTPPLTTGAPAVPTLIAKAVATPVPRPVTPVLIGTVTVPDAPSEMAVPLTVTELLVSELLPMLVSVLLAPEMAMLLIVPAVAGLIVKLPVPVGAIEILALAGFMLNAPSSVKLTPPPAPHCKHAEPLLVRNAPPLELLASR